MRLEAKPTMQLIFLRVYLRRQLDRAFRSKFVHSTSSLMMYTVAGQLIAVISSLVLARIYSPREFGLFGILLSFPALAGPAVCLNFDFASPAPVRDEDGAAVLFGAAIIAVGMSFLLSVIFLALVLTGQLGFGALPAWSCLFIWAILFFSSATSILQYWCVRRQSFRLLGKGVVVQNTVRAVVQTTLGFLSGYWAGLALGEIGGRAAQFARYFLASWQDLYRFRVVATRRRILEALARYKRFATVLLPPMVMDSMLDALPVLLLNLLFGLSVAGQYYLMRRVLDVPATFVSRTVSDAFYGKISEYARTNPSQIRRMLIGVSALLVALSATGFIPLVLFGPSIFATVFGEPWREAGLLAAVTVPAVVMRIGAAPVGRVFAITKKPYLRYTFTVTNLLGGTAVFGTAWLNKLDIVWTAAGLSLAYVLSYSVCIVSVYIAAGYIDTEDGIPNEQ